MNQRCQLALTASSATICGTLLRRTGGSYFMAGERPVDRESFELAGQKPLQAFALMPSRVGATALLVR